ncbi:hypothetical protein SPHINGO391_410058 [Sphingomonas aurantiaca]|uniref:Uncharacterized protein n=1 Tax=Sphingomonas aurantiaca TaxID=185949 RepID=A0A5E7YXK3_9SPHN|nr:hypothetical protein SPHINGO391_410058 [Sphingomonas aurantiaca]
MNTEPKPGAWSRAGWTNVPRLTYVSLLKLIQDRNMLPL